MSYYHGIMFDFDGTLVDTMHEYAIIASEEMSLCYQIQLDNAKQLYLETSGVPFFQQLDIIFGEDERNSSCAEKFETRKAIFLKNIRLDPEVRDVLFRIRDMGLSIAITSNNFQELIDQFLKKEPNLFDIVLGFGGGLSKGATQFMRVLDTFGIDRRYMLFVGDSLTDARKALAFGIDFVAISGTLKEESFKSIFPSVTVISSIKELLNILNNKKPVNN